MTMDIGGFQRVSLIDYPGKVASVVFTVGCNFRCWFCQNADLVFKNYDKLAIYTQNEIMKKIEEAKSVIDGVAITGGEPTVQKDLPEFAKGVKDLGLLVKLDTNGTNPGMLESMISSGLVDYVAMDVKAPFEKYYEAIGIGEQALLENVKKSISILLNSNIDYEFRTTALPNFTADDFVEIAKQVKGAKLYSLQQFDNKNILDSSKRSMQPLKIEELNEIKKKIEEAGIVKKCVIKNI
ncbi:MAG: anaerobic ribonucleoside-triphosphate reductase activating protein [Candidatus Micrarchaeia archaeon]